jgi:hypothetical protein
MHSAAKKKRQPQTIHRARVKFAGNPQEFTFST